VGGLALVAGLLIVCGLVLFLRWTPNAFPYGDGAVIEIYTLQALRGFLKLGPYSQFHWHHPGPLYFYCLLPFYELSGRRAIGLAAGALTINFASLATTGWIAARNSGRPVAAVLVAALAVYLWRADGLAASIWNPHIIILPLATLIVACAALAAGDGAALLVSTVVGSFLMQTHVATVPCVVVLIGSAFVAPVAANRLGLRHASHPTRFWAGLSIVVAAVLWFPPIVEELTGNPGNLTRLWRFFVLEHPPRQAMSTAFLAWTDMTTAVVRPHVNIGWGAAYVASRSPAAETLTIVQLALLAWSVQWAWKAGHRFLALLCLLATTTLLVAGWSITRVQGENVGDYQIFWISVIGALGWGALAATAVTTAPARFARARARSTLILFLLAVTASTLLGIRALGHARAYAVEQRNGDVTRKLIALDVERYIAREQVRRPLFHIAQGTWLDAACVILQVYKHHPELAVDEQWVTMFGDALSANGREDADFQIADRTRHAVLSSRPGDRVITAHDQLFVHVLDRR
jgi:hypothetical protein